MTVTNWEKAGLQQVIRLWELKLSLIRWAAVTTGGFHE